jgi:UDPglucose 6-dehydrogenase
VRISVIGLGKLGSPMAACFAAKGFTTIGVDLNESLVDAINEGQAPVFEPGLADMIAEGRSCLTATTDIAHAIANSDATFVIVPTPSQEDGGFSLTYVQAVMEAIGRTLARKDEYHLVVLTSTVMPGATGGPVRRLLEDSSGKRIGAEIGLCYSPEFIALGSVIRDFLEPDFLLIGESDEKSGAMLADIYRRVVDNDPGVARLNFVNAELAKIAVNTFVTTKIAFANMLARICERLPEASVDAVTSTLGLDSRIGAKYLRGAISYGGPCFPRDNIAFSALARSLGAPAYVAEATDAAYRDGITRLADMVTGRLAEGGTAGILGLSYKPNTDVVEESAGVYLARALAEQGVPVTVFDPAGMPNARRELEDTDVRFADSTEEAIRDADVVVIATAWQEFAGIAPAVFERAGATRIVIDCWRILTPEQLDGVAVYVALGDGSTHAPASAGAASRQTVG